MAQARRRREGGLLYAKLSPDGSRAAYVRGNNLFVEDLRTGATTALTSDGSPMIINGTSDWVYEEELGLRDAFEWSPDGRRIAYYQFDQTGVPEFALDQLHRRALSVHHQVSVPEGGPDECVGAHRRGGRGGRAHPVDERSPAIRATPTSPAWTGRRTPTNSCCST